MEFSKADNKEYVRIKGGRINATIKAFSGKEGDFFVMVSPTILVSGYGNTETEAKESFKHNLDVFCQDIIKLTPNQKIGYLKSLGFMQEKGHTKNFSKSYVDDNGVLKGLEAGSIKSNMFTAFA